MLHVLASAVIYANTNSCKCNSIGNSLGAFKMKFLRLEKLNDLEFQISGS